MVTRRSGGRLARLIGLVVLFGACAGPSQPTPPPVDPFPDGPRITCPAAPPTQTSLSGGAIPVQYGTPTVVGGAPAVAVNCTPPNGALFSIGFTAVVCTATDGRQRTDACTFDVAVQTPPRISLTRFAAFGDSITLGEDGRAQLRPGGGAPQLQPFIVFPEPQTYPGALEEQLKARYAGQVQALNVSNLGVRGESASGTTAQARFSSAANSGAYDVILLMEGTNDVNSLNPSLPPAAIAGLRTMIRTARQRGMLVYLATIPPEVPGLEKAVNPNAIPPFNNSVRTLAASENVPLVDVEAGFGPNVQQYIGYDGLHPNEAGYAKIADLFFNALRATIEAPTPTPVPRRVPALTPTRRR